MRRLVPSDRPRSHSVANSSTSSRTLRVSSTRPCPGVGGHEWTPTHSLRLGCVAVLRCCTAQIGYPSDALADDSSHASTGGCIPSVSVGVAAQTDLVVLVGLGVLAMFPVVQPESALQRLGHTGIVHPAGCCSKVSCRCDRPSDALRDSPVLDGGRWLVTARAGALPYCPWLATAGGGWLQVFSGTTGAPNGSSAGQYGRGGAVRGAGMPGTVRSRTSSAAMSWSFRFVFWLIRVNTRNARSPLTL